MYWNGDGCAAFTSIKSSLMEILDSLSALVRCNKDDLSLHLRNLMTVGLGLNLQIALL